MKAGARRVSGLTTESPAVPTKGRWRRTPEALVWMWLLVFMITLLCAIFSYSAPAEFAFLLCTLSSLAAVCVTHAGLRDVHTFVKRVVPVHQVSQRMHDMAHGWWVTGLLLGLATLMGAWVSFLAAFDSHPSELGVVLLLALVWHAVWVCAVYAWWGVAHPAHLAVPLLGGLLTVFWPGPVLGAWQHAPLWVWLLAAAYGLGAGVWQLRRQLTPTRSALTWLPGPGGRLDAWARRLVARAGFIEQGDLARRPWSAIFGLGVTFALLPIQQIGSIRMLEPWGSEITYYELWRIGFLCLFLLPVLRSSQWHWRYWLSPGGQMRRQLGLNLITSTLRFVAMWFCPGWAMFYGAKQFFFSDQSGLQILTHLALYLPVMAVDFWVATALAVCLMGAFKTWWRLLFTCVLLFSPVVLIGMTQVDNRWAWLQHWGHRQGVWLIVMTLVALMLTILAQRIWRKADLAQVWREYEAKTQTLQG
ncbi:hypothetical protein [Limnohabitans sp. Rim8]|uniref:hypothetical protein n=1 Tax=Limnohabitans sp. Rim8 TaxID=1100718 RepID=UPI0025F4443D|nr:hypothetical protein [Limnohabitans sp. Rim8]